MEISSTLTCSIIGVKPFDFPPGVIRKFAENLVKEVPEIGQVQNDVETGNLTLFQKGPEGMVREVEISRKSVRIAVAKEVAPEEQETFIKKVLGVAEELSISKLDVTSMDYRRNFRVQHWGNHHELAWNAYCGSGCITELFKGVGRPVTDTNFAFGVDLADDGDVLFAFNVQPRTGKKEIRSGKYDGDDLNLLCAIARVGGFVKFACYEDVFEELIKVWKNSIKDLAVRHLVGTIAKLSVPSKPDSQ